MALSLYEATVPSQLQLLRALDAVLAKAGEFAAEKGMSDAELIDARLAPDMLPLGYQVKSCAAHSVGALEGVRGASFSPDLSAWPTDLAGLRGVVAKAIAALEEIDPTELDRLEAGDCTFRMGETALPFTAPQFLLSFSQPNFYFHATAAYAILRHLGMKLGKRDFLGAPRLKQG